MGEQATEQYDKRAFKRVRMLTSVVGTETTLMQDRHYTIPTKVANKLVANGHAEVVTEQDEADAAKQAERREVAVNPRPQVEQRGGGHA
jgi:hypothetical protein